MTKLNTEFIETINLMNKNFFELKENIKKRYDQIEDYSDDDFDGLCKL